MSQVIDRSLLNEQVAQELLAYDFISGKLYWKVRDRKWFKSDWSFKVWNNRYSGQEAITHLDLGGYMNGSVLGKRYRAHRLAWLLHYGEWPIEVDHINGVRSDNRLINLRSVNVGINVKNRRLRTDNKSGYYGVYWSKSNKKWVAQIPKDGKVRYLGSFSNLDDAALARKIAEKEMGYHENHGRTLCKV